MNVSREKLLSALELVKPGLSEKGVIEQSSCFVFQDKRVVTFNGEIACSYKSPLQDMTGAVQAIPLLELLSKMREETIDVSQTEKELLVRGKRRRAGIVMENKVVLPLENLEPPKRWKRLPRDFVEALDLIGSCAGRDDAMFNLTCIHLSPQWVEAFDVYQFGRYRMKVPLKRSILLRQEAVQHIIPMNVDEFSVGSKWVHFRSKSKLVFSCMRYTDEYPDDLTKFTKLTGDTVMLPKSIADACDAAEVFSTHNVKENLIQIQLDRRQVVVTGSGMQGWYEEVKSLKESYAGPSLTFMIAPKLLKDLVHKYDTCAVCGDVLKVQAGKFVYVTSIQRLGTESEKPAGKEKVSKNGAARKVRTVKK